MIIETINGDGIHDDGPDVSMSGQLVFLLSSVNLQLIRKHSSSASKESGKVSFVRHISGQKSCGMARAEVPIAVFQPAARVICELTEANNRIIHSKDSDGLAQLPRILRRTGRNDARHTSVGLPIRDVSGSQNIAENDVIRQKKPIPGESCRQRSKDELSPTKSPLSLTDDCEATASRVF